VDSDYLRKLANATDSQLRNAASQRAPGGSGEDAELYAAITAEINKRKSANAPKAKAEPSALSKAANYASAINDGAAIGFSDELTGLLGAPATYLYRPDWAKGMSMPERYAALRDANRGQKRQFADNNPVTSTALNFAGGLLTGGAGTQVAKQAVNPALQGVQAVKGSIPTQAPSMLAPQTRLQSVAQGLPLGAVAGVGASEKSILENPLGVAGDAAFGAATAAPLSGLLHLRPDFLVDRIASLRNLPSQSTAERVVQRELGRDDMTPTEAAGRLQEMPEGATLLDVDAPNVQRLGEAVMTEKGQGFARGKRLMDQRQEDAAPRVTETIATVMGDPNTFSTRVEQFEEKMLRDAAPLYEQFRAMAVEFTPTLNRIIRRLERGGSSSSNILNKARRLAETAGDIEPPAKGANEGPINMTVLDYAKQHLDDLIETAAAKGTGAELRAYQKLNNELKKELDAQTGGKYAEARNAYEGPAKLKGALEAGRKFLRLDSDEISKNMDGMSKGEQEMFRLGAAKYLRDRMLDRSDNRDVSKAFFNNALKRERIRELFPEATSFKALEKMFRDEEAMFQTQSLLTANSRTAPRQAGREQLTTDVVSTAAELAQGNPMPVMRRLAEFVGLRGAREIMQLSEPVRDQIAKIIFNGTPGQREQIIRALNAPGQVKAKDLAGSGLLRPLTTAVAPAAAIAGGLLQERLRN